jgi:hypothetical protein
MKHTRHIIEGWRTYGDAAFSLLTFPIVVGLLYWLTRIACGAAFHAILGR